MSIVCGINWDRLDSNPNMDEAVQDELTIKMTVETKVANVQDLT